MAATLQQLDVTINTKNVPRSAEWYQRMLGLKAEMAIPDKTKPTWVRLKATPTGPAVMIGDGSDPFTGKKATKTTLDAVAARKAQKVVSFYFTVDTDIDKLYASVKRKGAKIVQELKQQGYGMKDFSIQDPDGYVVGVGMVSGQ
ncbi:MAG: VOC family protein [Dehalococcoidia bacterium]